jgi:hypothetical protein
VRQDCVGISAIFDRSKELDMHSTSSASDATADVGFELPNTAFEVLPDGRSIMAASKEELVAAAIQLRRTAETYRAWARAIEKLALMQHLRSAGTSPSMMRPEDGTVCGLPIYGVSAGPSA